MMKVFKLPCFGIKGTVDGEVGYIQDELRETFEHGDSQETMEEKENFNNMVDAITSLILAHAVAGIDVESPAYVQGVETAVDNISNFI